MVRVAALQVESGHQLAAVQPRLAVAISKTPGHQLARRAYQVLDQWPGRRFAP